MNSNDIKEILEPFIGYLRDEFYDDEGGFNGAIVIPDKFIRHLSDDFIEDYMGIAE